MGTIFLLSWLGQSITGRIAYNAEQIDHQQVAIGWAQYVATPDFWNRTLQNWQSEFLAIGSMAVLAIYLRQRGSPFWKISYARGASASGTLCVARSSTPSGSASSQTSGMRSSIQERTLAWPMRSRACPLRAVSL